MLLLLLPIAAQAQLFRDTDFVTVYRPTYKHVGFVIDTVDVKTYFLDQWLGYNLDRAEKLRQDSLDFAFTLVGARRLHPANVAITNGNAGDVLTIDNGQAKWLPPSSSADSTKSVSMDRDDNISGEKDFGGSATVRKQFGIGNLTTSGFSTSLDDEGLQIVPDTASKRQTPFVVMVNNTGFGTLWGVHETGIVDFAKQSAMRVYRNSNQSMSSTTEKVAYDAESWDKQDEYSPSTTQRFTATEPGIYTVRAAVTVSTSVANGGYLEIRKNGSMTTQGAYFVSHQVYSTHLLNLTIADEVSLSAGDYLEVYVNVDNSGTIYGGSVETFFVVRKVL